jgi:histone H3/H4
MEPTVHAFVFNDVNYQKQCKLSKCSITFVSNLLNGLLQKLLCKQQVYSKELLVSSLMNYKENNEVISRMIQQGNKCLEPNQTCVFVELVQKYTMEYQLNDECYKWLSGALEYLTAEIYELAIQITKFNKRVIVKELYIKTAIVNDSELNAIFDNIMNISQPEKIIINKLISKFNV